jgi:hypothetical protein
MDTTNQPPPASEAASLTALANRIRLQDRERRNRTIADAVRHAERLKRVDK